MGLGVRPLSVLKRILTKKNEYLDFWKESSLK